MSLSKGGYLILFLGVVLLVGSIFFTTSWSMEAWLILFIISIVLCTAGILMLIINLVKQIKLEKQNRL